MCRRNLWSLVEFWSGKPADHWFMTGHVYASQQGRATCEELSKIIRQQRHVKKRIAVSLGRLANRKSLRVPDVLPTRCAALSAVL